MSDADDDLRRVLEAVDDGYLAWRRLDRKSSTERSGLVEIVWSMNAVGHGTTPIGVRRTATGRDKLSELRRPPPRGAGC